MVLSEVQGMMGEMRKRHGGTGEEIVDVKDFIEWLYGEEESYVFTP